MRKYMALFMLAGACLLAQEKPVDPNAVFREPFTLRIRVDKDHYYEERYDRKIPYVFNNDVYLFIGENFGVNLRFSGDRVEEVTYVRDASKSDVSFIVKQEKVNKDEWMTMLTIKNNTKKRLFIDGLMTVPGRKGVYKTSILPVEARLTNFESWPHPIVQLVLQNIRTTKDVLPPTAATSN